MNHKKTLVFVHGWGVSSEIFKPLYYFLKDEFNIYDFDMPGFGQTPIEKSMALKDYADFVYKFLKDNKIEQPIITGHSFGGAVATKLALFYPDSISKLILVDASAIRRPRHKMILLEKIAPVLKPIIPGKLRQFILKLLKLDKTDWAQIKSVELKKTFQNVTKESLEPYLHSIKKPVLVIWGENDTVTPLAEGELIARTIPGAKLAVIKNSGHFVFLEKPEEFIKLIKEFAL
ncbi:MAG: alpha/beta hydrolase [Candidatus Azambacteria bacterium]|nr:alpha/beta hydrolase [Candidatus Azambacteria bacterium]